MAESQILAYTTGIMTLWTWSFIMIIQNATKNVYRGSIQKNKYNIQGICNSYNRMTVHNG
jgi:hypothetical protein